MKNLHAYVSIYARARTHTHTHMQVPSMDARICPRQFFSGPCCTVTWQATASSAYLLATARGRQADANARFVAQTRTHQHASTCEHTRVRTCRDTRMPASRAHSCAHAGALFFSLVVYLASDKGAVGLRFHHMVGFLGRIRLFIFLPGLCRVQL